jgi:anti-sigma factor RsiW
MRQFRLDHRWARLQMSAFVDGDLAESRVARMDRHLAQCARCGSLLSGLRMTIAGLNALPVPPVPAGRDDVASAVIARLPS